MRACQIQSAGACWLRASLRTARSSRSSCAARALTCLGIALLLPLTHLSTSYCSPFEEWSTSMRCDWAAALRRRVSHRGCHPSGLQPLAPCGESTQSGCAGADEQHQHLHLRIVPALLCFPAQTSVAVGERLCLGTRIDPALRRAPHHCTHLPDYP